RGDRSRARGGLGVRPGARRHRHRRCRLRISVLRRRRSQGRVRPGVVRGLPQPTGRARDLDGVEDLQAAEIEHRVAEIRERMRPLEADLAKLRGERDVLLTELRRRQRLAQRTTRADLKPAMREGKLRTIAELVAGTDEGSLDDFIYNLKTGGEVRLGFPGARTQSLAFTDGAQVAQAHDLARAAELYAAGWELGSPGRPGVRVHFPGTRQERLVAGDDVYARPGERDQG